MTTGRDVYTEVLLIGSLSEKGTLYTKQASHWRHRNHSQMWKLSEDTCHTTTRISYTLSCKPIFYFEIDTRSPWQTNFLTFWDNKNPQVNQIFHLRHLSTVRAQLESRNSTVDDLANQYLENEKTILATFMSLYFYCIKTKPIYDHFYSTKTESKVNTLLSG